MRRHPRSWSGRRRGLQPCTLLRAAVTDCSVLGTPLGPADLAETRHTTTLETGLTLTRITRRATDPDLTWTEEMLIPAGATSPDPDAPPRAVSDRDSAEA